MKRKQYYDAISTIELLISNIRREVAQNYKSYTMENTLYAFYGIVPKKRLNFSRNYHDAEDKVAFRQDLIARMKKSIRTRYKEIGTREDLKLFSDALFEPGLKFGITPLDIPDSLHEKIKENLKNYSDGREIILEIFQYWREEMKKYKQQEIFDDRVVAKPAASKRSSLPRNYVPELTEEQRWEKREEDRYNILPDDSFDDYHNYTDSNNDDGMELDDSASNWAYNERHDV